MSTLTEAADFVRNAEKTAKERPILFKGEMVRAILSGQKTQTRRVVKCETFRRTSGTLDHNWDVKTGQHLWLLDDEYRPCPYGQPGDRLYVREAFSYSHGCNVADVGSPVWYWADGNPEYGDWTKPKPSIHMPRWACRIVLEIVSVRVERLNAISESDCWAEGIERSKESPTQASSQFSDYASPRAAYMHLWESINGPESWQANPWVWVVEFKKVAA